MQYLNRQLYEILRDLANILPTSLSANPVINLPFPKTAEPTRVLIDKVVEDNQQVDEFRKAFEEFLIDEVVECNRQILEFGRAFDEGKADVISDYFELILQCSSYPEGFKKNYQVVYANESRQLVVDYQLPTVDEIVPTVEIHKQRTGGNVIGIKKKERARHQIYENVIASTVLRTIYEVLRVDQYDYVGRCHY